MKRFHVHVGVDDLAASIRFYNRLFASQPAVVREGYAKWMLEDPRGRLLAPAARRCPGTRRPHQLLLLNQREELDRRPAGHPMGDVLYDW